GVAIDGNSASRVMQIDQSVVVSISAVVIANGKTVAIGDWGAGIYNAGILDLSNSTVTGNSSSYVGGGIYNSLYAGNLTLTDVRIANNISAVQGGGLFNDDNAVLTNVTISGNSAPEGGGIHSNFHPSITLMLDNVTVSNNLATSDSGGGIYNAGTSAQVTLANTIVAGNQTAGTGPDAFSSFTSLGNNLIGMVDGSDGWAGTDLTGSVATPLDARLTPIASNGGPTQTLLPMADSPAIGAGSIALIPA